MTSENYVLTNNVYFTKDKHHTGIFTVYSFHRNLLDQTEVVKIPKGTHLSLSQLINNEQINDSKIYGYFDQEITLFDVTKLFEVPKNGMYIGGTPFQPNSQYLEPMYFKNSKFSTSLKS